MFLFKFQGYLFQLIATLIGCILTFSYGILIGITPSNTLSYHSASTPLKNVINENDANWINLYVLLGKIFGCIIFGFVSNRIGRKPILLWCGILQIVSWFYIAFGNDIFHIHLSRICCGLSAGGTFTVLPIYISEISEDQFRGNLGSYVVLFQNIGIIFGFIFGPKIHYDIIPLIGLIFSTFFTLSFPFVQESPYFYLIKNDKIMLEKSLRWFRSIRSLKDRLKPEYLDEIEKLKNSDEMFSMKILKCGCCNCRIIKIFLITFAIINGIEFCGALTVFNHLKAILTETTIDYDKNTLNFIVIGTQTVGILIISFVADRINRIVLITFSSFGTFFNLLLLGGVIYTQQEGIFLLNEIFFKRIVTGFVCSSILLSSIGIYSLSFVTITEIFPYKQRAYLMAVTMGYVEAITFLLEFYFKDVLTYLGLYGYFWTFSGFYLLETIIVLWMLPETRNKSFKDIQSAM